MKIKENFLPIPDAPNYEINSQLIVRNKKRGTTSTPYLPAESLSLYVNGKRISRMAGCCRRRAVAEKNKGTWLPIPSLNNLYEINKQGLVRVARTKRIKKPHNKHWYFFIVNGTRKCVPQATLLWEVHGILSRRKFFKRIPVTAEFNDQKVTFETLSTLAKFLAKKTFWAFWTIMKHLSSRVAEFAGWKITYHLPKDLTDVTDTVGDWAKVKRTKNVNWLKIGVLTTIPAAKKASD